MKTRLGLLLATACLVVASAPAQTLDVVHRFQASGGAYSRLIPGSRFALIEGAGHHPEIEQPEVFVDRVAAFLKE